MWNAQKIVFKLLFAASFFVSCNNDSKDDRVGENATDVTLESAANLVDCSGWEGFSKSPDLSSKSPYSPELLSRNTKDSVCGFKTRRDYILQTYINRHTDSPLDNSKEDSRSTFRYFTVWAQAALELQNEAEIEKVNSVLESSTAKPWNYGSSFDISIGFACGRKGDYDFVAFELAKVLIISDKSNIKLSDKARKKILDELLPLYGNPPQGHDLKFKLEGAVCSSLDPVPETENHIIMVNVSKYLTNQIRGIDNSANGFDDWMIDHFNILSTNFFDEYNSRPYQEFAMEPIVTLAALTTSPKVKLAGLKLIEQILATQAVQTNRMRRYSPFRRQPGYKETTESYDGDGALGMAAIFTGAYESIIRAEKLNLGASIVSSVVLFESVPLSLETLSLFMDEASFSYEQEFYYHGNEEHYSAGKNYLLSSSGRFHAYEKCPETFVLPVLTTCMSDQQHGWATATILIPRKTESQDYKEMIQRNDTFRR